MASCNYSSIVNILAKSYFGGFGLVSGCLSIHLILPQVLLDLPNLYTSSGIKAWA